MAEFVSNILKYIILYLIICLVIILRIISFEEAATAFRVIHTHQQYLILTIVRWKIDG